MSQHEIAHPLALGAQYQLGNHKATYKASMNGMMLGVLFLIISILLLLFFIYRIYDVVSTILLCICIFIIFIIGLFLFVQTYQDRMLRVFIYDSGLIYVGRASHQTIHWQNVQAVWHKVTTQGADASRTTSHSYTVNCTDGTQLRLDPMTIADLQLLGQSIEVQTARHLYPTALDTYQMGQDVVFGPLTVTQRGLSCESKFLAWMEMESIRIDKENGYIAVRKQGMRFRWGAANMADVPNVEVLRMLIQHITGVRP